ncbi:MAG: S8 family serine peptidase [Burkholderiaceae bacterium]
MNKRFTRSAAAVAVAMSFSASAFADDMSAEVAAQISAIRTVKTTFTPAQKKLDSSLAFGILAAGGDSRVASFRNAITPLSTTDKAAAAPADGSTVPLSTTVFVTIYGSVSDSLASAITGAGGKVISQHPQWSATNAILPIASVLSIAERSDVTKIRAPSGAHTNVGALTSQGYVSHEANKAVAAGITGAGVTVGVLSDSAYPARVAALKASGDLPASASVLPGQEGPTDNSGENEGTAMMEIVHDMAPGANIIFATAFNSEQSFADNIIALAAAGCKVIVDDISYFDEPAFQDGIIQQAINQVTAAGAIYFSSAANSGSLTKGTSGTWEGDFNDGGPVTGVVSTSESGVGRLHNFAATGTQNYDPLTVATTYINLFWSDPVGNSSNDYDLYVLNTNGTAILGFGGDAQTGAGSDPYEIAYRTNGSAFPIGSRVVVVQYSGVARALHIDTERGALSIATSGATFGHNAGDKTMSMAATYWNSAKTGVRAFTGFANTNETFSSDGPRKIFYNPDGSAITAGNFLFATSGGRTLQKPDLAAADGVSTKTPGFLPFFGTSAAAPHAAGIAALIRSARPDYTVDQVKAAMRVTALDSMAAGTDRDSGYGIAMANAAVQYALTH